MDDSWMGVGRLGWHQFERMDGRYEQVTCHLNLGKNLEKQAALGETSYPNRIAMSVN
jgi:hypothetical protein